MLRSWRIVLCCGGAFFLGTSVPAFDTGLHASLTRQSMLDEGFDIDPLNMGVVMNWLVDYYSSSDITDNALRHACEQLHFDNLFTTGEVATYWANLAVNTKRACERAARDRDPARIVALIGISLHAVQDFYTHSCWLDYYPPSPSGEFQTVSWWDDAEREKKLVYTGGYPNNSLPRGAIEKHGSNFTGLNKDNHDRHLWLPAYVMAHKASRQWIRAMEAWTDNAELWKKAQKLDLSANKADLTADSVASMFLSLWARQGDDPSQDHHYTHGRWTEWGSGDTTLFAAILAGWIRKFTVFQNEFRIRKTHLWLTEGLSKKVPPKVPTPNVPKIEMKSKLVVLRTKYVEELPTAFFETRADVGGDPDYYPLVSLHKWRHRDSTIQDRSSYSPGWTALEFVPATLEKIAVKYALFDEDSTDSEACDINPTRGKYHLDFEFNTTTHEMTGDLSGVHDTPDTAVESKGAAKDKNRAKVQLYMYTAKVADVPRPGSATIILQVTKVTALDNFDGPTGRADFYPRWGLSYEPGWNREMYILDQNSPKPLWFLRMPTQGTAAEHEVQFEVWDADSSGVWWDSDVDDKADICPAVGRRQLRFKVDIKTGAISGDITGRVGDTFTVQGTESPRAKVEFKVLKRP